ncbi:hypothetical protein BU26DRAFT_438867, partial [Trematosphaeria pertusa]
PKEPWHNRHLIPIPTSQILGLENFTVHPATPPVLFTPIELSPGTGNYAFRAAYSGDDLSQTPYIAALTSNAENHDVSMKVIPLPDPTDESIQLNPNACPENYECKADAWTAKPNQNGELTALGIEGLEGAWEPIKDAGKGGWHVYWKPDGGDKVYHPIQIDIVPYNGGH